MAGFHELPGEMCFVSSMRVIPKESVLGEAEWLSAPKQCHTVSAGSDSLAIRAGAHFWYCINLFLFL